MLLPIQATWALAAGAIIWGRVSSLSLPALYCNIATLERCTAVEHCLTPSLLGTVVLTWPTVEVRCDAVLGRPHDMLPVSASESVRGAVRTKQCFAALDLGWSWLFDVPDNGDGHLDGMHKNAQYDNDLHFSKPPRARVAETRISSLRVLCYRLSIILGGCILPGVYTTARKAFSETQFRPCLNLADVI